MNLSAIFSKTGKGVQEASGKTSQLSRADRAVLSAIDGKTSLAEIQKKFDKLTGPKFDALIQQLDKDGYIREVSSGSQPAATSARPAAPAAKAPPPKAPSPADEGDGLDFTQAIRTAPPVPKGPPMDLAAAARAEAERKAKELQANDYKSRHEADAKAKAEADAKTRAAAAEARARTDAEAKARAEADAKTRADAEAKVKAAREAAIRMATEAKAKAEAEAKTKTDAAEREREAAEERARKGAEDKARVEAELNAKLEAERAKADAERRAREDAERRAAETAERTRKELEEKAKREAEELRQRLEAEMQAKLEAERVKADAERRAREEEDRKRREEEDRRRKEEDERRAREEAERRAKEEAERKAREEEDRKRREEEERRRKEEDERRAKEEAERVKADAERRAREEAERKKREEEDRRRKEEDERRARDEAERKAKEEAERKARDEADRKAREESERRAKDDAERRAREDADRRAKEESEAKAKEEAKRAAEAAASLPSIEPVAAPPPPPPPPAGSLGDSLLADLDSFGKREEEEQAAREEAEKKAKEEAARKAKEDAERRAKEEADRKAKEEEARRRKEEEEQRAKEEAERRAREEEERRREEEAERKRKAKEAAASKQAEERSAKAAERSAAGKGGDGVDVGEEDLDMDDIKRDQKALSRAAVREQPAVAVATGGRPKRWGKPAAIVLFVLLAGGVGLLHVMPMSTADYEKAAAEAVGAPVKIGSARLSVITGIELKFENVSIGDAVKIRQVRGFPAIGSLFGGKKAFSRLELEGVSVTQSQAGEALFGKVSSENFRVARVTIKQLTLDGPLKLPPLDVDAAVSGDGGLQSVKLSGGDKLVVQLSPKGSDIAFDISAGSLALPFVPALSLSEFGMKGSANRDGVVNSDFDGRVFDGLIKGSARIRWGANWTVEGALEANGLKVAVFAPALVSDGKLTAKGTYNMGGAAPAALYQGARLQGDFKIEKGVLGSFDLTRALQTGGAQSGGRTVFSELTGQGTYDKGALQLRNIAVAAGAMNAGASLDIDANGGLSGRVAADVKTPTQTLRATLIVSGKLQDPVIRK